MRAHLLPIGSVLLFIACGCPQKTGTEAAQSQPTPSQPTPSQPAPSQPAPSQPTPSQPAPPERAPSQPAPSQPAPSQPAPSQPKPPPTKGQPPAPTQGSGSANEPAPNWPQAAPGIGQNCGANDTCAKGLTCVAYYGIAGPRGPQFKSCEIKCKADANCPTGHQCVTIADGPGQVCRN